MGGWVGSIHDAIGPRLATPTGKLDILEHTIFPKEKIIFDPRRKITRVFLRKTKIYLLRQKIAILITAC